MSDIIRIKIDVTKIDKNRLFVGKTGAKYLDATLLPSRDSKYGDSHMIVQDVSKEERLRGVKGAIIGNAKTMGGARPSQAPAPRTTQKPREEIDETVPF